MLYQSGSEEAPTGRANARPMKGFAPSRRMKPAKCGPRGRYLLLGADRPASRAGHEVDQKDEAIENSRIAAVEQREEASWRMAHEIGDRHVTGQDESHRPGEQTEGEQHASDDF